MNNELTKLELATIKLKNMKAVVVILQNAQTLAECNFEHFIANDINEVIERENGRINSQLDLINELKTEEYLERCLVQNIQDWTEESYIEYGDMVYVCTKHQAHAVELIEKLGKKPQDLLVIDNDSCCRCFI